MFVLLSAVTEARDPQFITKNSEGKEFWLCFMKNFRESAPNERPARSEGLKLQLFLTSSYDAKARVQIAQIGFDQEYVIKANTVFNVQLPPSAQLKASETAEQLAVHITADTAIAVYGLNSRFQTTDTYMGLPIDVLGTEYRAVGYTKLSGELMSAVSVVATEDGTEATITPTANTSTGKRAGQPFTVRLKRGDVYTIYARFESIGTCDLTGTHVSANKKIAVFSGHQCAYVPPKVEACNHLVEQLPPISAWGKHYYLGNLRERSRYTYRVIAAETSTRVFEDARLVAVLRAGEYFENLNVNRHVQVTADKPILVAQFAQGFRNGDSVGDPMMILVSPTQQFLKQYRFATPINGQWHHYINVVAPTGSISSIRLNGRRIDSTQFSVLGESRYSIAQVPVPFGTHLIKGDTAFGLYSYGFGYGADAYDAYGNMTGQSFFELDKLVDTLPPLADGRSVRDDYFVMFRDDRTSDRGMKSVRVLTSTALEAQIPKIDEGAPQVSVRLRPSAPGVSGRVVFRATDAAGNEADYTVCYVFDSRTERYGYILTPGSDAVCASEGAWMVGAWASIRHTYHNSSFRQSGNLTGEGVFTGGQGIGGWGGLLVGRRLSQDFVLSGRLSISSIGGELLSADTTRRQILDTSSGRSVSYTEGTLVGVSAPQMSIGIAAEFFPLRFFYVFGGLQTTLSLGSAADVRRTILEPSFTVYDETGERERSSVPTSLDSWNTLRFGVFGGLGATYPITFRMSVFVEGQYTTDFGNVLSDADWSLEDVGINLGVRYRF